MTWALFHQHSFEWLGYLPDIIRADDPRPAKEQIEERYAHGGGWNPMAGWERVGPGMQIIYHPDDGPIDPIAAIVLPSSQEMVIVFDHAWVMVVDLKNPDSFEVARMD